MARRIGTLGEKSLHAALKAGYAQPGDRLEYPLDNYIVDIFRPGDDTHSDQCIEIQTRSLGKLKHKLTALLDRCPVRLVYPVAQERYIVRITADGERISRRKSPRRGTIYQVFPELVSFPTLAAHPHFTLDVVLTREEEIWMDDGRGSWRRKRWSIYDRHLLDVFQVVSLATCADFAVLLPADLPALFDTRELAQALGQSRSLAQKMVYCLRAMGVVEVIGKRGHAALYQRAAPLVISG